jgi:hypothetical protein
VIPVRISGPSLRFLCFGPLVRCAPLSFFSDVVPSPGALPRPWGPRRTDPLDATARGISCFQSEYLGGGAPTGVMSEYMRDRVEQHAVTEEDVS